MKRKLPKKRTQKKVTSKPSVTAVSRTSSRTKKSGRLRTQSSSKRVGNSLFAKLLKRFGFLTIVLLACMLTLYFFVLPSVLVSQNVSKNILIISSKLDEHSKYIYFAHFLAEGSNNRVVSLPADAMVEVPGGYGEYPLQSVYQLLKIDKKDDQFIAAVFSELLKTSVDEIQLVDAVLPQSDDQELSRFFLEHALNKLGKLQLHKVFSPLALHYQTESVSVTNVESLSDFAQYQELFKTISGDVYQYCSVAVINASGKNGKARETADSIENTGALVIRVDDTQEYMESTSIYYATDPVDCVQLVSSISGIFPTKIEAHPLKDLENAQQYRANVIIFLGAE